MNDGTKYGKYIQLSKDNHYGGQLLGQGLMHITDEHCPNCHEYYVHWVMPEGTQTEKLVGHPPHEHKENEILFFIGLDPENPDDLGGTFEISFGDPLETHVINQSCCVTVPGGLPHGKYVVHETHRPWMFVRVHEAPRRTETPRQDLLTQEERDSIIHHDDWKAVGYDEDETK